MKLKYKALMFISTLFIIICIITFCLFYVLANYRVTNKRANIAYLQLSIIEEIKTNLLEQSKTVSNILLNIDEKDKYDQLTAKILNNFNAWQDLINEELLFMEKYYQNEEEEEEEEKELLISLKPKYNDLLIKFNNIIKLNNENKQDSAVKKYKEIINQNGLFNEIIENYINFSLDDEISEVRETYDKATKRQNMLSRINSVTAVITFFVFIFIFYTMRMRILRPVRKITTAMANYSKGNKVFKLNIKSKDEIGFLAESLDNMINEIHDMQFKLIHSEKMSSIGQLAAGIAHEINNPIGYIKNNMSALTKYISIIKKACDLINSPLKKDDMLNEIKEMKLDFILNDLENLISDNNTGIVKIIEIINNLKVFVHFDSDDNFSEADINNAIKRTLTIANNETKYIADVILDLQELPPVKCIMGEINQVLLNIIINAAQAIKQKHSTTAIQESGEINIKTYKKNKHIYCEISDNGCGINKDNLSKIFDPFFTTKEPGQGTGLGLNISYNIIVKKHKGDINVESEAGKGTKFIIKLPI